MKQYLDTLFPGVVHENQGLKRTVDQESEESGEGAKGSRRKHAHGGNRELVGMREVVMQESKSQ